MCVLYIFRFLHQTTTFWLLYFHILRCISFVFYIKPQLQLLLLGIGYRCISFVFYIKPQLNLSLLIIKLRCISFVFYIKPQRTEQTRTKQLVVYLSFSTSNHNLGLTPHKGGSLYIFRFLHQTTTKLLFSRI